MTQLELEIKQIGQKAIGAYEKGNLVEFDLLCQKQAQLKEELHKQELAAMTWDEIYEKFCGV